jgi:flagellar biosynthesis protein FlhF
MRLKSFFANTIEEAIGLARQELGPDAMLVNSKRTGAEAQHLGMYEVVVCGETEERGRRKTPEGETELGKDGRSGASRPFTGAAEKLSQDVWEIRQQMEKLALTLARSGRGPGSVAFDPELSRAFTALTDAELDTELAYDIVGKLSSPVTAGTLRSELAKLVTADSALGNEGAPARAVALIGPPGSGKTSALVKLAVQQGIGAGRSVEILTTDTFRIAAAEELRSYAAILGIGCQVLETPAGLARAITEFRTKDLILIDTPGLCQAEWAACEELAELMSAHGSIDAHLVLSASMRAADLRRIAEQYSIFRPRKLLFTHMDETQTFGPLVSRSARMALPVSFLSRGQRIPEDLEAARPDLLLDLVLGPETPQAKFGVMAA